MSQWSSKKVEELKDELRSRGLSVKGKKSDLVSRLEGANGINDDRMGVLEGEVVSSAAGASFLESSSIIERIKGFPTTVVVVSAIVLVGTTGGGILFGADLVNWMRGSTDYELIDFDSNQTRAYAEGLVNLGHPEWEGRLSGTVEEENTAQSIKMNFSKQGYY